ncbi:MAG: lamin tail domain-containing protein [Haloarculaceae archaeon]
MRHAALLLVVLALVGCSTAVPLRPAATPTDAGDGTPTHVDLRGRVVEVIDGDTVTVRLRNGTRERVRLVGVDTPEVYGENTPGEFEGVPDTATGRACLHGWGERASEFARAALDGRRVGLRFDPNLDRRGYYGRLLAYVVVENRTFDYRLVSTGHARVYDSDFVHRDRYLAAEARARRAGRGLWTCATGTPTATAVADGGTALAVSVTADAPGDDNENPNGETVTLRNRGETAVDLDGWTVADAAGHTYRFGDVTLAPGAAVTLHSGSGRDTATDVYWGLDRAVWNNDGDTVTVRDASGTAVVRRTY